MWIDIKISAFMDIGLGQENHCRNSTVKMLGTRTFCITILNKDKQWMKLCCTEQCCVSDLIMHRIFIKHMQLMNRKLHKNFKITQIKTNSNRKFHIMVLGESSKLLKIAA